MSAMNRVRYAFAAVVLSVGFAAEAAAQCVSDARLMSQRGTFPNRPVGPVAWGEDRLGVVRIENETRALYFGTYDERFNSISGDIQVATGSVEDSQFLFWNGEDFGLFYRTTDNELVLQRLHADGTPMGEATLLTRNHGFFPEDEVDIVWDPYRESYLVLHSVTQGFEKGLWLTELARDASVRLERLYYVFIGLPALPQVAPAADKSIGLFFIHQLIPGVSLMRINPDNTAAFPVQISPTTPRDMAVASAGDRWGVAKWMDVAGGKTEIRWQVVNTRGANIISDRTLFPPRGVDVRPIDLTYANDEWALSYSDALFGFREQPGEFRLRRFVDSGALNSDTTFSPDRGRNFYESPHAPVWTGSSYVTGVAFLIGRYEGSDSYLLRNCPLLGTPTADVPYALDRTPVTFHATASGGTPAYSFEWDFGDRTLTQFGPTVTHTYDRPGTYVITLTTTDAAGGRDVTTMTLRVLEGVRRRAVRK